MSVIEKMFGRFLNQFGRVLSTSVNPNLQISLLQTAHEYASLVANRSFSNIFSTNVFLIAYVGKARIITGEIRVRMHHNLLLIPPSSCFIALGPTK